MSELEFEIISGKNFAGNPLGPWKWTLFYFRFGEDYFPSSTLKEGSTGLDVEILQRKLNTYFASDPAWKVMVDGIFTGDIPIYFYNP